MLKLFYAALLAAPLYVWRFELAGTDTNFLMALLFVVIGASVVYLTSRKLWPALYDSVVSLPHFVLVSIALIVAASVISLLAFGFDIPKFGQWLVLYAQPLAVFFLFRFFYAQQNSETKMIVYKIVYWLIGIAGIFAITQYTTGIFLPSEWLGNANEPKRALSFFAHPNAYALFVTPLLAWLLPDIAERMYLMRTYLRDNSTVVYLGLWAIGVIGMFFSLSRGAWLGFAAACIAYALVTRNKKAITGIAVAGILCAGIITATPNLRYRVLLPFQGEKSTVARFSIWDTAHKMIADSPVFGKGIHGFNYNWDSYNTDPNLDHYNFPHNFFLNFWIDLGFIGMLGFAVLIGNIIWQGLRKSATPQRLAMALFAVAIVIHGLIDIPYLKNDLALVFWMILAVSFANDERKKTANLKQEAVWRSVV